MPAPSDALVLFGATGDLAHQQILPSLFGLVRDEGLNVPPNLFGTMKGLAT